MPETDKPIRCFNCKKVICTGTIKEGNINIKCKCGTTNKLIAEPREETKSVYEGAIRTISS